MFVSKAESIIGAHSPREKKLGMTMVAVISKIVLKRDIFLCGQLVDDSINDEDQQLVPSFSESIMSV
jgi:hypothetical protein